MKSDFEKVATCSVFGVQRGLSANQEIFEDGLGVSKNRGKTPKMDGLFHGTPIKHGMIWVFFPYFWKHPFGSPRFLLLNFQIILYCW